MDFEKIKQAAWVKSEDGITGCFERCAYISMLNLYDLFRRKAITQEQAEKQAETIEQEMMHGIKIREMYLHTCQMRVALAGIAKDVDPNRCPIMQTLDDRGVALDSVNTIACAWCGK